MELIKGVIAYVTHPDYQNDLFPPAMVIVRKKSPYAGYLAPPGGARKENENSEEAAIRELWEETRTKAKFELKMGNIKFLGDHDKSKKYDIDVLKFKYLSSEWMAGDDVDGIYWLEIKEAADQHLAPPFLKFYKEVKKIYLGMLATGLTLNSVLNTSKRIDIDV